MRLHIIPFVLVALLMQAPTTAFGIGNQEAAEKIANTIGDRFPDASIDVSYKSGKVWLRGEAVSKESREKIVKQVFGVSGVKVDEINDEIQIVASKSPTPTKSSVRAPVAAPVPVPKSSAAAPRTAKQAHPNQQAAEKGAQMTGNEMAPYPAQQYQAAYGLRPGQQSPVPAPYAPTSYPQPQQQPQQPAPQYGHQYPQQYQPAYAPNPQAAYHPEAYGQQGPLPGQYNQPNVPDYAWPAYANYPNYSQVSYPRQYSPKAWPYIGPYYPYPQTPLGWRKVTLENHDGWWWLDFDDGTPSGPFSGLFRQPRQYMY